MGELAAACLVALVKQIPSTRARALETLSQPHAVDALANALVRDATLQCKPSMIFYFLPYSWVLCDQADNMTCLVVSATGWCGRCGTVSRARPCVAARAWWCRSGSIEFARARCRSVGWRWWRRDRSQCGRLSSAACGRSGVWLTLLPTPGPAALVDSHHVPCGNRDVQ